MRNIYQPIDQAFRTAYENTDYCVPEVSLCLRMGDACPPLDRLLRSYNQQWAVFVTAWNPGSILSTVSENEAAQAELLARVQRAGWPYWTGFGRGRSGDWPAEESLLVLGPTEVEARALGAAFGQVAVVGYRLGGVAELWSCRRAG